MSDCEVTSLPAITSTISGEVTGTFKPGGLTTGGLVTQLTVDDTMWYPLPATPLANRNQISVQNQNEPSAEKVKLQFYNTAPFEGSIVYPRGERFYLITDAIILYAKAFPGQTVILTIEELA